MNTTTRQMMMNRGQALIKTIKPTAPKRAMNTMALDQQEGYVMQELPPLDLRYKYMNPGVTMTPQPVCYRPLQITEALFAPMKYNEGSYLLTQPVVYPRVVSEPIDISEKYFVRSVWGNPEFGAQQYEQFAQLYAQRAAAYRQSLWSGLPQEQQQMFWQQQQQQFFHQQQQQQQQAKPKKKWQQTAKNILSSIAQMAAMVVAMKLVKMVLAKPLTPEEEAQKKQMQEQRRLQRQQQQQQQQEQQQTMARV